MAINYNYFIGINTNYSHFKSSVSSRNPISGMNKNLSKSKKFI